MKNGKFFVSCVFLGFLLTAFVVRLQFITSDRLWPDEALYASQAGEIGNNISFLFSEEANQFHGPLFSFFLSWGRSLFNSPLEGYRFIAIVFNWVGLWATFLLARELLGIKTAILSLAFLAFNRAYFNNAGFILIDSVLAGMQALFILSLYRMNRFSGRNAGIFLISGLLMIYLKWYAIIFVLSVSSAYCLFFVSRQYVKKTLECIITLGVFAIPVFIKILGIVKSNGPATFHATPWWAYFPLYLQISGGLLPLIFLVYGAFVLRIKRPGIFFLLMVWICAYLGVLSCVSEKDVRYLLPVFPCVAIMSGYGLKRAIGTFFNNILLRHSAFKMGVVLLLGASLIGTMRVKHPDHDGYVGFFEAGEWIKNNSLTNTVIFAGSIRAIRLTAGIPTNRLKEHLGPLPQSLHDLKKAMAQAQSSILEIDRWEYSQPAWAYPLTSEKAQVLESLTGAHLVKVIYKRIAGKRSAVVWLFSKM
ncbi:MAG: glycosyltransferase family 39 protein [Candidatus Omnitrophica bacterium]|nr:glycosyltransferase family 39 protein [Candidatus Omnitrophota bacterium]